MSNITTERKTCVMQGLHALLDTQDCPVAANKACFAGGLAALVGGYVQPAIGGSTAQLIIGRFENTALNRTTDPSGGAAGAIRATVKRGAFTFDSGTSGDAIAQANVGSECYVIDDHTVGLTSAGNTRAKAGLILAVMPDGQILVQVGANGVAALPIQVGITAAMAGTPGTVTVSTGISLTATSTVVFSRATSAGTPGNLSAPIASRVTGGPGTAQLVFNSTGNETSTIEYLIIG